MQSACYFSFDLNKTAIFSTVSVNAPSVKFHDNPLFFLCGQAHRRTEMTNSVVAFRSCANSSGITHTNAKKM